MPLAGGDLVSFRHWAQSGHYQSTFLAFVFIDRQDILRFSGTNTRARCPSGPLHLYNHPPDNFILSVVLISTPNVSLVCATTSQSVAGSFIS
jgi:hypothetical protein